VTPGPRAGAVGRTLPPVRAKSSSASGRRGGGGGNGGAASSAGRSNRRKKSTAAQLAFAEGGGGQPFRSQLHRASRGRQGHAHHPPPPSSETTFRDLFVAFREGLHEILLRPRTVAIPRWITPRRFAVTYSECFGHASFMLVAASYYADDFLTLRCVAVVGSASMLLFTYFHPHGRVLWLPFKWNLLFIAINSYRIGRVVFQKYWAEFMSDEMKRIQAQYFSLMDPVDFAKLVKLGTEETYAPGDLITSQNEPNHYVRLILSGQVEVLRDGVVTYVLEEGNFVSESGLHAGLMLHDTIESCCSIVARRRTPGGRPVEEPVRTVRWDRNELIDLLDREPVLSRSLTSAMSWDIVRKLKGQRTMLLKGEVADPERWTVKRREQNDDRYAAILSNVLSHPEYRKAYSNELDKYRVIHHIDDEKHRQTLERCGWTLEELKLGKRHRSSLEDEDEELEEDVGWSNWKWRVHSLLARVLG